MLSPNQRVVGMDCMEKHVFCFVDQIIIIKCVCLHARVCYLVDVCGRGGAHGCFLWENGRSGVRGQCLEGVTVGMR